MTRPSAVVDMRSSFAARSETGDFLNAEKVDDVVGLCLSGGGYRAMIYHVGALIRLNELGFLPKLREVASVSGGSITAGMLAVAWPKLSSMMQAARRTSPSGLLILSSASPQSASM
jgi:predicted acylesterase/phospholipase RssA